MKPKEQLLGDIKGISEYIFLLDRLSMIIGVIYLYTESINRQTFSFPSGNNRMIVFIKKNHILSMES